MSQADKQLQKIYHQLTESAQSGLLDYAQFLLEKYPAAKIEITEPVKIPRPKDESVIAAIKRLSATYPMLKDTSLFNQTSTLMTQHIMQGRDPVEVIDEIELIFKEHYASSKKQNEEDK